MPPDPNPAEPADAVDVRAVAEDDALLDRFGAPVAPARPASLSALPAVPRGLVPAVPSEPIAEVFELWRSALEAEPPPHPPDLTGAALALRRRAGRESRRRASRSMIGVAAAICGLLFGSAVIGARTAGPGDLLWPVTQVVWGQRADSVVAGQTARGALVMARAALHDGETGAARSAMVVASTALPRVADRDGHGVLQADFDELATALDQVDPPAATLPVGDGSDPADQTGPTASPGVPEVPAADPGSTDRTTAPAAPTPVTRSADPTTGVSAGGAAGDRPSQPGSQVHPTPTSPPGSSGGPERTPTSSAPTTGATSGAPTGSSGAPTSGSGSVSSPSPTSGGSSSEAPASTPSGTPDPTGTESGTSSSPGVGPATSPPGTGSTVTSLSAPAATSAPPEQLLNGDRAPVVTGSTRATVPA